jgi:hypothetical protein
MYHFFIEGKYQILSSAYFLFEIGFNNPQIVKIAAGSE